MLRTRGVAKQVAKKAVVRVKTAVKKVDPQGSQAAHNGIRYEQQVESIIEANGGIVAAWKDREAIDFDINPVVVFKNVPFTTMYGAKGRGDHLLLCEKIGTPVRIEVRSQNVKGTADEKLPYLMGNCEAFPEDIVIVVLEGNGFKTAARTWFYNKAASVMHKTILVMDVKEFAAWAELNI